TTGTRLDARSCRAVGSISRRLMRHSFPMTRVLMERARAVTRPTRHVYCPYDWRRADREMYPLGSHDQEEEHMTTATLSETDIRVRDAVRGQLDWDPEGDASAVGVTARQGAVTLTGFIDTYAGKLAAERAAKRVHG